MPPRAVLVDTSAWILALRKGASAAVVARVGELLEQDLVLTAAPIKLELLSATKTLGEYDRLKLRLDSLQQIPVVSATWAQAAKLGFDLRRHGVTVPHMDLLIASVAMSVSAILLHSDSDFERIAEHSSLVAESASASR